MRSLRKTLSILLILSVITTIVPVALAVNDTATPTATATATPTATATVTATPTATATVTATPIATATTVITPTQTEKKFRVGPTVKIRPLNDEINQDQDGLVELYMDNPSLNDVTLNVDARVSVPSGIHVYGQGFGAAGAAGTVYGTFSIPPGSARTINIVIKAEKIGDFSAQFSGLYWPEDNKDAYQPISLTHPFKVKAASQDPLKDTSGDAGGAGEGGKKEQKKSPGLSIIFGILVVTILAYALKRKN